MLGELARGSAGYVRGVTSSRARTTLLALLVVAAPVLAACGGGDSTAKKDQGPTRPAYIAQVDALCKKVTQQSKPTNRKLQALVNASGSYSDRLRRSTPLLRKTYALQKGKLDTFKRVRPPAKDRAQIKALIAAGSKALDELRGGIPIAQRGDLEGFIDIAFDANGTRAQAERLGTTYGFRADCFAVPIDLGQISP
jgi:hypothetical protein